MSDIITVPFHGNTLFVINHDGEPYTAMRPIVQGMGLDWKSQYAKVKSNPRFCVVEITTQLPGDDQTRAVLCIPVRKLPGWLMTIHPGKVKEESRELIITYQNECDDALWNYWTKGEAINPRMPYSVNPDDVLTQEQADFLRGMLTDAAKTRYPEDAKKQASFLIKGWSKLKSHFKVGYRQIPQSELLEAASLVARHAASEGELLNAEPSDGQGDALSLATKGFEQITAISRMALYAMNNPDYTAQKTDIESTFDAIWAISERAQNHMGQLQAA
jgi:hypothetical protein